MIRYAILLYIALALGACRELVESSAEPVSELDWRSVQLRFALPDGSPVEGVRARLSDGLYADPSQVDVSVRPFGIPQGSFELRLPVGYPLALELYGWDLDPAAYVDGPIVVSWPVSTIVFRPTPLEVELSVDAPGLQPVAESARCTCRLSNASGRSVSAGWAQSILSFDSVRWLVNPISECSVGLSGLLPGDGEFNVATDFIPAAPVHPIELSLMQVELRVMVGGGDLGDDGVRFVATRQGSQQVETEYEFPRGTSWPQQVFVPRGAVRVLCDRVDSRAQFERREFVVDASGGGELVFDLGTHAVEVEIVDRADVPVDTAIFRVVGGMDGYGSGHRADANGKLKVFLDAGQYLIEIDEESSSTSQLYPLDVAGDMSVRFVYELD